MRQIEEHKRLEDGRLQDKGKAPTAFQYQREHWTGDSSKGTEEMQGCKTPLAE